MAHFPHDAHDDHHDHPSVASRPTALPTTRREFLRTSGAGLGLLAFSQFAPAFLTRAVAAGAPAPERDRRILVLVQLAGGNDGLNTVVPVDDDAYYRVRPRLALPKADVHRLGDNLALHPACGGLAELYREGHLGIVHSVGYPNPNRSHFRSMEIWETGSDADETLPTGWLGRYLDATCAGQPTPAPGAAPVDPPAVSFGQELPQAFGGATPHPTFHVATGGGGGARRGRGPAGDADTDLLEALLDDTAANPNEHFLQQKVMDALVTERRVQRVLAQNRPEATYPTTGLGQSLQRIAGLIAGGLSTRVYFASLGGFDTHTNQLGTHQRLLTELSEALKAFQADLRARGLSQQVLTMTFSEFGRRIGENGSGGTDHGTAAPLFVLGDGLADRLVGQPPALSTARGEDLRYTTDFRQVYATVLERWLQTSSRSILGGQTYAPLPFLA